MDMLAGKVKMENAQIAAGSDAINHPIRVQARDVTVHYGAKQALFGVSIDIPDRAVTAFIGPSGCGKSTFLRCINRMNDTIEGCVVGGKIEPRPRRHLRSEPRRGGTACPHRHGVPEAQSVPQVDLREHRLRPEASTASPSPRPSSTRSS